MVDKHQAHLTAALIKDSSDFTLNTSSDRLTIIQNNLDLVNSTLPATNIRPERQLELQFGIRTPLLSLHNFISQWADDSQKSRIKNTIKSLKFRMTI